MFGNSKSFSRSLLVIAFTVLLSVLGIAQQVKQRVVQLVPYRDQPIEIVAVKVKGVPIKPKQKFDGDSDWLNGMTVTLKNVSDRPVAYVSVLMGVPYGKKNSRPVNAGAVLQYGVRSLRPGENYPAGFIKPEPLLPGETVDVVLTERERDQLHSYLAEKGASTEITELNVRLYEVFFEGDSDTKWSTGRMLRLDPNDPNRWIPIESGTPSGRAVSKPKFVQARFIAPTRVALPPPDPDVDYCTFRDGGEETKDCTAKD